MIIKILTVAYSCVSPDLEIFPNYRQTFHAEQLVTPRITVFTEIGNTIVIITTSNCNFVVTRWQQRHSVTFMQHIL